jgi:adenylate cyclase
LWSLALAERGLGLAIALWHSVPGTIALYGAALLHFTLAMRTVYERRLWSMQPTEWVRLWAGFSLPLLLIRHAVATRLATSLYGFEPSYEGIVVALIAGGTQGLQLALLAPGWVHGCLGLWLRLRHRAAVRRLKPVLLAVFVLLPLLSAAGFLAMARSVRLAHAALPLPDPKLLGHAATLDAWRHNLVIIYLALIVGAFVLGRLRNRLERKRGDTTPSAGAA